MGQGLGRGGGACKCFASFEKEDNGTLGCNDAWTDRPTDENDK